MTIAPGQEILAADILGIQTQAVNAQSSANTAEATASAAQGTANAAQVAAASALALATGAAQRTNNLSDLSSDTTARANLWPVTLRPPTTKDTVNFVVGDLWLEKNGQISQLESFLPSGGALWDSYPATGPYFGDLAAYVAVYSTRRGVSGWTANFVTVMRATDLATQSIAILPDGRPDVSSLRAFAAPTAFPGCGGVVYVPTWNDQSGNGNDATQSVLGSMPSIWMDDIIGDNIPLRFDSSYRTYVIANGPNVTTNTEWPATGTSGNPTITLTGPFDYTINFLLPGYILTGTNVPIVSMNASISGTTLTVASVVVGAVVIGMTILGAYTVAGTTIISGSGTTWTVSISQNAGLGIVYGYPVVVSINATTGVLVMSVAPTGTPGPIIFRQCAVFLDIPSGVSVPWQSFSFIMARQFGAQGTYLPLTLGATGEAQYDAGGSFVELIFPSISGVSTGARLAVGDNISSGTGINAPGLVDEWPTIDMIAMGGTSGRNLTYQVSNTQGSITNFIAPVPNENLVGGSIGYSRQASPQLYSAQNTNDTVFFDLGICGSQLQLSDASNAEAAISLNRGWAPQIQAAIACDGSSTTACLGTANTFGWPYWLARRLGDLYPVLPFCVARGGSVEYSNYEFYANGGVLAQAQRDILVFHAGLGDSLQQQGTLVVTGIVENVLTVATNPLITFVAPGCLIQLGGATVPVGTTVTAISIASSFTVTISATPVGTPTSLILENDTAENFWINLIAYGNTAVSFGYRILYVSSANRLTFVPYPAQYVEFNTAKTFFREAASTLPGWIGHIDLEDFFQFGSDGATMVVTAISGSNVTVNQLSGAQVVGYITGTALDVTGITGGLPILLGMTLYVAGVSTGLTVASFGTGSGGLGVYYLSGSTTEPANTAMVLSFAIVTARVRWAGMPYSIAGDTGGQTIIAVSGNTITVSGPTTGLSVGSIIQAINPAPWISFPTFWNNDGQHFRPEAYRLQGMMFASFLIENGLLP